MATPGVGQDIEDMCTRCGDVWHVVVAKVGERVVKVVCKLCGSQHNYRGDKNPPAASASSSGGASGTWRPRKRKVRSSEEESTAAPVFDPSKPPRGYSPKETYAIGERVVHPTFGTGVVAGSPGPGKVDVHFPTGERTLACAKSSAHLERPVAVSLNGVSDSPQRRK